MWQFIISGYIPGTDFQITFEMFELFIIISLGIAVSYNLIKQVIHVYRLTIFLKLQSHAENHAL